MKHTFQLAKQKFDAAWTRLVADAPEGAHATLFEKLTFLVNKTKGEKVTQPAAFDTVEELLDASRVYDKQVHEFVGALMVTCGASYKPGPIKLA